LNLSSAKRDDVWYATVTDENGRLVACGFSGGKKAAEESSIHSLPNDLRSGVGRSQGDSEAINVLHRIYVGKDINRPPIIVLMTHSKFLRGVYKMTMRIPKGKVTTYGKLAEHVGLKRASRAVGNAMARNPLPLVIPCHRVVRSTLQVGNYGSERNGKSRTKRGLLVREGVQFVGEKISPNCVWDPP
jgi:methylated-DNA-[protein]-cysteine S-methyltransferase